MDFHTKKVLLRNPYIKSDVVKMPRLAASRYKLEPIIKSIAQKLDVQVAENGRIASRDFSDVMQELTAVHAGPRQW